MGHQAAVQASACMTSEKTLGHQAVAPPLGDKCGAPCGHSLATEHMKAAGRSRLCKRCGKFCYEGMSQAELDSQIKSGKA